MGNDVKIKNKRLLLDSDAFFVGEPQSDPTHPSSWSIILKAYPSYNFDNSVQWWTEDGGHNLFRENLYSLIMTDHTVSLSRRARET
ncbi:unnamed protein product [Penicillium bialowiezense]